MLSGFVMDLKKKILIVEDNNDCRELLVLLVTRLEYDAIEAASGIAAIDQASKLHPDLILMDLNMPQMSGEEATAHLKADPCTRDIPVVINTAFHEGVYTDRAMRAGAVAILHKPFSLTTLQETLSRYLSRKRNREESPQPSNQPGAETSSGTPPGTV
jgi:two-component system, cell cycle response regulator DivK